MNLTMTETEAADLEQWIKIEYPDMAEEFAREPKSLAGFITKYYPYLIREFAKATDLPQYIVYCT